MKELPILFSGPMVRALLAGTKTQTRRVVKFKPEWFDNCCLRDPGEGDSGLIPWPRVLTDRGRYEKQPCPYGDPGDRLWVRESFYESGHTYRTYPEDDEWRGWSGASSKHDIFYRADGIPPRRGVGGWGEESNEERAARAKESAPFFVDQGPNFWRSRPSIHMPRWASRITLVITGVRVERLNEISEADAIAEGIEKLMEVTHFRFPAWRDYSGRSPGTLDAVLSYKTLWESINGPGSWDANPWVWVVEFKKITPA